MSQIIDIHKSDILTRPDFQLAGAFIDMTSKSDVDWMMSPRASIPMSRTASTQAIDWAGELGHAFEDEWIPDTCQLHTIHR